MVTNKHITSQLKAWYDLSTVADKEEGKYWYADANAFTNALSLTYHTNQLVCAGIVAALSPQNRWFVNQRDAENLIAAHYYGASIDHIIVGTYGQQARKAVSILRLEKPTRTKIIAILGKEAYKTIAFFLNISNPEHDAVTLDRHMINLLSINPKWVTRKKGYNHIARCVVEVANTLDLKPHQLQAIVWVTYRRIINGSEDS